MKYEEYNTDKGPHSQLTRTDSWDRNNQNAALHLPKCRNIHRQMDTTLLVAWFSRTSTLNTKPEEGKEATIRRNSDHEKSKVPQTDWGELNSLCVFTTQPLCRWSWTTVHKHTRHHRVQGSLQDENPTHIIEIDLHRNHSVLCYNNTDINVLHTHSLTCKMSRTVERRILVVCRQHTIISSTPILPVIITLQLQRSTRVH